MQESTEAAVAQSTLNNIRRMLQEAGVAFNEVEHEECRTSEESARARGEPLHSGAKALVIKIDKSFGLFVLPADFKLDSGAIKRSLHVKNVRFATQDELQQLTGLVPGSVPPFGKPLLPFDLYADRSIADSSSNLAFNAGSLTHSIVMAASDWIAVAKPVLFAFTKR